MLYIRTDMNNMIATGHMMRCLSVADAAKRIGKDTTFIVSDEQAVGLLKERGYNYIVLYTQWDDMDSELPALKRIIKEKQIKSIFIDSYQVTENYLQKLSMLTKTFYIDDVNAFSYPVNGVVCYANYWEKFNYKKHNENTDYFLGTKYVPLRKAFSVCEKKKISRQVKSLLLLSGGTDSYNAIGKILGSLDIYKYLRVDVICGKYNERYEELKEKYLSYENVYLHRAVTDIENYMERADLAISAGGTTLYELCAMGTPTISYTIADNQLDNAKKFHEDGMIAYAGDVRKEDIVPNILTYLKQYEEQNIRQEISEKMQNLVDGKGALRIAEALLGK